MSILAWIVVGLIAGWLAGQVMKGGGYGVVVDIVPSSFFSSDLAQSEYVF